MGGTGKAAAPGVPTSSSSEPQQQNAVAAADRPEPSGRRLSFTSFYGNKAADSPNRTRKSSVGAPPGSNDSDAGRRMAEQHIAQVRSQQLRLDAERSTTDRNSPKWRRRVSALGVTSKEVGRGIMAGERHQVHSGPSLLMLVSGRPSFTVLSLTLTPTVMYLVLVSGPLRIAPRKLREHTWLLELLTHGETQGIILPFYRFRVFWDCLIFLFVSYTAITLPIILAYPDATGTFEIVANLELVMDIVFIIDIGLNFRTAYIEHAELVVDRKRIVRKYLSKWFAIDLIGSIPWEIIFRIIRATSDGDAGSAQVVTLVKILKAPKMLRLGRFLKVLESIEGAANVGRIIMLMVMMAVFVHWISCLWYAVASADPDGFLERKGVAKDPWHEQYFENYYTSLMMVMGDSIFPITSWEKLFASLVVLVGACANATIFANVAAYVAQIGMMSARHKQRIDGIVRAVSSLRLTGSTAHRIRSYFDYVWERHLDFAGQDLIHTLPIQLRKFVCLQTHEKRLRASPFFATCQAPFLAAVGMKLTPEVYLPDEYIIVVGEVHTSCYFILRGRVQLIFKSDYRHSSRVVIREDYFGELGLFQSKQQTLSARAMTHLDTYRLTRLDFEDCLKDHPAAAMQIVDLLPRILPQVAKTAAQDIYSVVGMHQFLRAFNDVSGIWRPKKGLANKIRALVSDPVHAKLLAKLRERNVKAKQKKVVGGSNGAAPRERHGGCSGAAPRSSERRGSSCGSATSVVSLSGTGPSPPSSFSRRRASRESNERSSPAEGGAVGGVSIIQFAELQSRVAELTSSQHRVERMLETLVQRSGGGGGGGGGGGSGGVLQSVAGSPVGEPRASEPPSFTPISEIETAGDSATPR